MTKEEDERDDTPAQVTMLDQFAMAALAGALGPNSDLDLNAVGEWPLAPQLAQAAYSLASAMLAERRQWNHVWVKP